MTTPTRLVRALLLAAMLGGCTPEPQPHVLADADDAEARGPNNGRLLTDGGFTVELAIYETGLPPEYRAWIADEGRAIAPQEVELRVALTRLGNQVDEISFRPQDDFLRGLQTVHEPHSFVVSVDATYAGRQYHWEYDSFEGRTRIHPEIAEALGLETMIAGPAIIDEVATLYGDIASDASRVREIRARFDGAIRAIDAALGDSVRQGQRLAEIDSNESLQTYAIDAPIDGIVTERNANPGEQTAGRRLLTLVDTSVVWANLAVFPGDRARVHVGARAVVTPTFGGSPVEGTLSHINRLADASQAITARVVLDNDDGALAPGSHVTAEITVAQHSVPLAVKRRALQSFRDFTVVYAQVGDEYEVRMLELGRRDGEWVEVLGGLEPGTRYVVENSYVLKADIEKSGAAHDH